MRFGVVKVLVHGPTFPLPSKNIMLLIDLLSTYLILKWENGAFQQFEPKKLGHLKSTCINFKTEKEPKIFVFWNFKIKCKCHHMWSHNKIIFDMVFGALAMPHCILLPVSLLKQFTRFGLYFMSQRKNANENQRAKFICDKINEFLSHHKINFIYGFWLNTVSNHFWS